MTRVAMQGIAGAFSEQAVRMHFGTADIIACRTFDDAAAALETDLVDYAVLPVENLIAGSVPGMQQIAARPDFKIVAEVVLPVHHCLMGLPGANVDDLHSVLSHPVALLQCSVFLNAHPRMQRTEWFDTAGAAQHVATLGNIDVAAIAARPAAERYGLTILVENIEDRRDNITRFLVLTRAV
jgi:arogenate/prephenate dehydratase